MKIKVEQIANLEEEEIIIKCQKGDKRVEDIVATLLRLFDLKISAKKDKQTFILNTSEIYYFDCVDDKTFCYTENDTYEVSLRLYELETFFINTTFLRINKSMIVDISKIKSFKAQLNGRMEAILINDEKVEISRNYVPVLKTKLGEIKK